MVIVNNEQLNKDRCFFMYLPKKIRKYLTFISSENLEEVRLRLGKPISLLYTDGTMYINKNGNLEKTSKNCVSASRNDISEALELISSSSIYAVENQIKQGFITVDGGHRIGLCGRCIITNGEISFINNISGLNYRFAHEIIGVSDNVMPYIMTGGEIKSTLIISPPGCGKTTMLRDIVRNLSDLGKRVSIVDERSEIAGITDGVSAYKLGDNVDVLDNAPKAEGMLMMLRSMSPEIILTDEIGTIQDMNSIEKILRSGVRVIASVHGRNRGEIIARSDIKTDMFDCVITLGKHDNTHTIEEIYT